MSRFCIIILVVFPFASCSHIPLEAHEKLMEAFLQRKEMVRSRQVCLSMISGTNFESEWGQLFPVRLTMIIRFGGHLTRKKGNQLACADEKGSHLLPAVFIRLRMLQLAPPPLPIVLLV